MAETVKQDRDEPVRCPCRDAWCTRDRCMFADENGTRRCVREEEERAGRGPGERHDRERPAR